MSTFHPARIIKQKREGGILSNEQIEAFLNQYNSGKIPDYQMAALLMAIFFKGLTDEEAFAFTKTMLHSGEIIDHPEISAPKIDKHSTGGVGDKISLPLAPLLAEAGLFVPMISGRGLGHTGGTLDKLASIPGFSTDINSTKFKLLTKTNGAAFAQQTDSIVPLDKKLYALRDVTGTVESYPLMCASIMSKKLAEGIDGLILDVKVGTGAFMKDINDARKLATLMIAIGRSFGKSMCACLTNMNQPLGRYVGNSLEVLESIEILKGHGPDDVTELTLTLGEHMLALAGKSDLEENRKTLKSIISSGAALERFKKIVSAQKGDIRVIDDPTMLPISSTICEFTSNSSGVITSIHGELVGHAVNALGGGRMKVSDKIDPKVGFKFLKKMGHPIERGEPIVQIYHSGDSTKLAEAQSLLLEAICISEQEPKVLPLIHEIIIDK